MSSLLDKILSYPENEVILEFLGVDRNANKHAIVSFEEKDFYTHEGLESFLEIDAPIGARHILDNQGIAVIPQTGEIIAFQFGRFDSAFKVLNPEKSSGAYRHIKNGLRGKLKFRAASKICLGYFSNVHGDRDTVVDIRHLGKEWGLGIYMLDSEEEILREYYTNRTTNLK